MSRPARPRARSRVAPVVLAVLASWAPACAESRGHTPAADPGELVVARGDLEDRVLLTGELEAVSSEVLMVPRTRAWRVAIRWMVEDGARVEAGQKVVEFDNAELVSRLEEKRLAALEAQSELERRLAEDAITTEDKEHAVAQREIELQKAALEADVPAHLMAARDYEEKQLALRRARVALAQAEDELAAHRKSAQLAARIHRIDIATAERDIRAVEADLDALVLKAPRDGIAVVADLPWENRPLQVGDSLWPGMPVVEIPDLSTMQVAATLFDVDDGRIAPGMEVTCVLDAYPARDIAGEIASINPVADSLGKDSLLRGHRVIIALDATDPERMRPGMSVKAIVHVRGAQDRVIAPRAGLDVAATPPRARLAGGGDVAVDLDFCTPRACVIEDGLAPGTRLRRAAAGHREAGL